MNFDYPDPVANDWPELLEIVERFVKPERLKQSDANGKKYWWRYLRIREDLYKSIENCMHVLVTASQAGAYTVFGKLPTGLIYSSNVNVFALDAWDHFATLSSRAHEIWALMFGSSMADTPTYTVDNCFKTFPLPFSEPVASELQGVGEAYHAHRATMMIATDKGMTKTYNRFHDPHDKAADIVELRRLHAMMDDAVLRAYGWDDLAARAHPGDPANGIAQGEDAARFLTEDDEDDHKYQNRLFWPAPFRDELLARLLKLNEERAAAEKKSN